MKDWPAILFALCVFVCGALFSYLCVRSMIRNWYGLFRKFWRPRNLETERAIRREEFKVALVCLVLWILMVGLTYASRFL